MTFQDNKPGIDWIFGFEKRNKDLLTRRKPEILTLARAKNFTKEVADQFFELWTNLLTENGLLDKPENIFNADETGLSTDIRRGQVYVK